MHEVPLEGMQASSQTQEQPGPGKEPAPTDSDPPFPRYRSPNFCGGGPSQPSDGSVIRFIVMTAWIYGVFNSQECLVLKPNPVEVCKRGRGLIGYWC